MIGWKWICFCRHKRCTTKLETGTCHQCAHSRSHEKKEGWTMSVVSNWRSARKRFRGCTKAIRGFDQWCRKKNEPMRNCIAYRTTGVMTCCYSNRVTKQTLFWRCNWIIIKFVVQVFVFAVTINEPVRYRREHPADLSLTLTRERRLRISDFWWKKIRSRAERRETQLVNIWH